MSKEKIKKNTKNLDVISNEGKCLVLQLEGYEKQVNNF